jgi:hypothetical protein
MPVPILQQPIKYALVQPDSAAPDFDQLRRIDAHYRAITGAGIPQKAPVVTTDAAKDQGIDLKPTVPITKHTCGNCGRLRSKRYYSDHPIKPGETPIQEFCGKCQRDASCTSSSSSSQDESRDKHSKKKKKGKAQSHRKVTTTNRYLITLLTILQRRAKTVSTDNDSSSESPALEKQQDLWSENKVSSDESSSESPALEKQQNHWSDKKVSSDDNSPKSPALEKQQNPRSKHVW